MAAARLARQRGAAPALYRAHALGLNINLAWGLVQLVFGAVMVWLARRSPPP